MRTIAHRLVIGVGAFALAAGLTACGSDDEGSDAAAGAGAGAPQGPVEPVAAIDSLSGQQTSVALDQGFVDALGSLKVTPAPVGDATIDGGTASFPITSGHAAYYKPGTVTPYVTGNIRHNGSGLQLTAGKGKNKTVVQLINFEVEPGTSRLVGDVKANGKLAAENAYLFFLDGSTLKPLQVNQGQGTAVLSGTQVKLSPDAAPLLNDTFGVDAFKENFLIGVATITMALPQG